ncbi:MAG: carbohydrate ABC transporter permease [Oscillospiraceae bacterium]|nr:carbohydrate ABC transporter permease [Oscillospiraceae bacterium]
MNTNRLDANAKKKKAYSIFSAVVVIILAILFTFPLYWIITGSFKTGAEINSTVPVWFPSEWDMGNYQRLMTKRTAPLFDMNIPLISVSAFGYTLNLGGLTITGPTVPAAIRWLINTVFMSVGSMLITCLTAAMAGYVLAKKRFWGKTIIFSLVVCAMALPKQVILIPLLREMSALNLYDTIWAVIFPIVGWPFGVFLLKQFAEGIPTEMVEACRIDGAGEWRTFTDVMFPMIKPGVGACAIFTFINSWNDYFMQLIMLTSNKNLTISLGIATMQGESSTDYGLLMAGAALASVPIIIVFLIFQKYFTKGITMGAVKG